MADIVYSIMDGMLPFSWLEPQFMKRALLALLFIAPACAAMGVLVVNFRMAFFSDAVSHSAFTGVAFGLLLGISPMLTLVAFGVIIGLGIMKLKQKSALPTDTVIAVILSASVALGIVIISHQRGLGRYLEAFLYGDVLAVGNGELLLMFALLIIVLAFVGFTYNELFLIGINEELARTRGAPVQAYNLLFSTLLAMVVTVSIRAIGILLVTAMLIVPAATARSIARSAGGMFWYALATGLFSAVLGLMCSYLFDTATGATVILVACALFALSYPVKLLMQRNL